VPVGGIELAQQRTNVRTEMASRLAICAFDRCSPTAASTSASRVEISVDFTSSRWPTSVAVQ
jgi:hypothetical protein